MTLPFTLPDWAPSWLGLLLVVLAILFALAFLLMPFSVFGVKGRLDLIEARLDEIQGEIRSLALRLPEPVGRRATEYEPDAYAAPAPEPVPESRLAARPPIPPAPRWQSARLDPRPGTPARTEPRFGPR